MELRKLSEPFQAGRLRLKNRIVMAPMCTNYSDVAPSQRLKDYLAARAKGGVGLIQLEATPVISPGGGHSPHMMRIDSDETIPHWASLLDEVKKAAEDVKLSLQIYHAGPRAIPATAGAPVAAPSTLKYGQTQARELSKSEIADLVGLWGEAARRAKDADFDAVCLHFAHGFLVSSFLSPLTNRRTDEFGGPLENRLTFARQILCRCREQVGPDFPIIVRINCDDFVPGGMTFDEAKILARVCVELGANIIDVSGAVPSSTHPETDATMSGPIAPWAKYAVAIKEAAHGAPVIAVRRIISPELAEKILCETNIDLIAFGRPFLADPDFAMKAARGEVKEIVPCISCCQGCYDAMARNEPISCLVNPAAGREASFKIRPSRKAKFLIAAGGGPAGLEAARAAASMGHKVVLYEKRPRLGGLFRLASSMPGGSEIKKAIDYFEDQLSRLKVDVRLETGLTSKMIEAARPDQVIVAVGPLIREQRIKGAPSEKTFSVFDVIEGKRISGERCVITCSGFCCDNKTYFGCEASKLLALNGHKVTIITSRDDVIKGMSARRRPFELLRMRDMGIGMITEAKIEAAHEPDYLTIKRNGAEESVRYDAIIAGAVLLKNSSLAEELSKMGIKTISAGTCANNMGNALDAILEGSMAARQIC